MPLQESCLVCELPLMWIENDSPARGDYFHLFSMENAHLYKSIHRPVPCLEDFSAIDDFALYRNTPARNETFNSRGKVEPRASVATKVACGPMRDRERCDVRMIAHFMKAIFEAR